MQCHVRHVRFDQRCSQMTTDLVTLDIGVKRTLALPGKSWSTAVRPRTAITMRGFFHGPAT